MPQKTASKGYFF